MKKALSLFLVAIMLLTMIPMGVIGVFAEDANVVSVGSVKEWNDAVTANGNFAGKTLKLTASFGGAEAEPAALTSISDFQGTLDGNGKTISNATVTYGLLVQTSGTATVKNLTLSNVTANDGGNGHAGTLVCTVKNNLTVTNVTVENCAVSTSTAYRFGGLIANIYDYAQAKISNCNIDCDIAPTAYDPETPDQNTTSCQGAGLLIGVNYGDPVIENCTATGTIQGYTGYVGGIIGTIRDKYPVKATITNVVVNATKLEGGNVGGAIGRLNNLDADEDTDTITMNNCVFACGNAVVGLVDTNCANVELNINNCYTTVADYKIANAVSSALKVNGITVEVNAEGYTNDSVIKVDSYDNLVKANGDVIGHIDSAYAQVAPAYGEKFAVRFITTSLVDVDAAINVVFKDAEGNVVKTFDADVETYDTLIAYDNEGAAIGSYEAKDLDAQKFFAVVIKNIPLGAYNVEVTASYVTEGGITITDTTVFEFDANGNIINGEVV